MNDLIKINYETDRPTVLGRDLHAMLEVDSNYTTWLKRMCEYGFAEGTDFISCFPNSESETHGGQNKTDHQLTIDMAKELCMLQRTDKGKQCRQYFLAVERQWNDPAAVMARALQMANKTIAALTDKVEQDKPKVLFASAVETSHTSILVGELAKLIRQNGKEIGQNRLFQWMRENGFMMRYKNIPTQYSMERKLMEIKERTITNPDGSVRTTQTTLITGKGQTYFVSRLLGESA